MAEKIFKVVQLDDGSITVDAPASEFPESGYFTLYDKSASAKGECTAAAAASPVRGVWVAAALVIPQGRA